MFIRLCFLSKLVVFHVSGLNTNDIYTASVDRPPFTMPFFPAIPMQVYLSKPSQIRHSTPVLYSLRHPYPVSLLARLGTSRSYPNISPLSAQICLSKAYERVSTSLPM